MASNASANVPCGVALEPGRAYDVRVESELAGGAAVSSAPTPFLTMLTAATLTSARPMWHANSAAQFVLLRRAVAASSSSTATYLSISAKPTPDWRTPHHRNTSHLLCGYKLWVGGVPLGAGPGRKVGGGISVDTYNLTALLGLTPAGDTTIAVEAYYGNATQQTHPHRHHAAGADDDMGGVLALLHTGDGERGLLGDQNGVAAWEAFDATDAFGPSAGPAGYGAGTHTYFQPTEDIDGALYPHGWRRNAAGAGWSAAAPRATPAFADGAYARQALPVALRDVEAASFTTLPGAPHHYVIDFGRELQGGPNITFSRRAAAAAAGRVVTVRLGEQLLPNGTVRYRALSKNVWESHWTLGDSSDGRAQSFVTHEYSEFRYVEVIGAPEPPTKARVRGWAVRYPFDGDLNEGGDDAGGPPLPTATAFASSSEALDTVWELVRWTVEAAAIDLNTDSNTRQRDVCTLDAYLATLYQAGTFPTTAFHHRRRVTQFMYEFLGFVNTWTEFQIAPVGALAHFTADYDDAALLDKVWHAANASAQLAAFSLTANYDAARSLVVRTPKPLIDWPRNDAIDITRSNAGLCDELCAEMNGHAVTAQTQMAALAARLGLGAEARAYAGRAAAIRAAANATFAAAPARCTPAGVGACFTDEPNAPPAAPADTTAHASVFALAARLPGSAARSLGLVPFLRARNARRGHAHGLEVSGWVAGFLLRGLYSAAGELDEGELPLSLAADAAQLAWEVLTHNGTNSWLGGMVREMGATMTTESWIIPDEGGGTMSHPWTAAPAFIVPRFLMGVRPLEGGWRRVAVRPLPPSAADLASATLATPTPRGVVTLAFAQGFTDAAGTAWAFDANVTLPGNTRGQVCVPRYTAPRGFACASEPPTERRGAMLCLADDVTAGFTRVIVTCRPPASQAEKEKKK